MYVDGNALHICTRPEMRAYRDSSWPNALQPENIPNIFFAQLRCALLLQGHVTHVNKRPWGLVLRLVVRTKEGRGVDLDALGLASDGVDSSRFEHVLACPYLGWARFSENET